MIPWQHLLCLSQSHHGSRSQYSSLAHASTQGFAEAPGFLNEAFGSTDQRPDWCTKTLREERREPGARPGGGEGGGCAERVC